MLIKCPECGLLISDKALSCPHCGYPMKPKVISKTHKKTNKRRRLPNGFGQISEIKNQNLKNPFRAMITVGKTNEGRCICKPLKPKSYFPTYNEAYSALLEYNKNPYELSKSITVKEIYDKWLESHLKAVGSSKSALTTYTMAWKYCSQLYDKPIKDIKTYHLKECIENGTATVRGVIKKASPNVQRAIKSMFNQIFDYAIEYEIVDKNYSRNFKLSSETGTYVPNSEHLIFTDKEMSLLWKNVNSIPYIDIIIIQCYSGWRPRELGLIKITDVDLKNGYFKGGIKTKFGKDRLVPIHPKIIGLVKNRYNEAVSIGSDYLFNCAAKKKNKYIALNYYTYSRHFSSILSELNINEKHRPHDGRKHFITMAKKYNLDEYAIKYIVGHTITDITEKVYTERELSWLKKEMEKIK